MPTSTPLDHLLVGPLADRMDEYHHQSRRTACDRPYHVMFVSGIYYRLFYAGNKPRSIDVVGTFMPSDWHDANYVKKPGEYI